MNHPPTHDVSNEQSLSDMVRYDDSNEQSSYTNDSNERSLSDMMTQTIPVRYDDPNEQFPYTWWLKWTIPVTHDDSNNPCQIWWLKWTIPIRYDSNEQSPLDMTQTNNPHWTWWFKMSSFHQTWFKWSMEMRQKQQSCLKSHFIFLKPIKTLSWHYCDEKTCPLQTIKINQTTLQTSLQIIPKTRIN